MNRLRFLENRGKDRNSNRNQNLENQSQELLLVRKKENRSTQEYTQDKVETAGKVIMEGYKIMKMMKMKKKHLIRNQMQ